MGNTCPCCSIPWDRHPTIAAVCLRRKQAEEKADRLAAENSRLRQEAEDLKRAIQAQERCGNGG